MLPDPVALRGFFDHVRWADLTQLDATRSLDDAAYLKDHGFSFGTIHKLMLHMLSAQNVWLQRFEHQPMVWLMDEPAMQSRSALEPAWGDIHTRFDAFLARQTRESLEAELSFRNLRGDAFSTPLWRLVTHVLNHSTIHRAQLNSMLKLSGATPPPVDYWSWVVKTVPTTVQHGA
jgi:uncharacterized damage-inducible protein DinB